ncbi:MAG TPA: carboxypeptidase regulatory-like domain-containing protein, partial [Longimicrobiaceae bacterium]|nr:carboxypeptidase regulatory-like domain-containing protein [Longimicrobiaceae bacterium]
MYAINRHRSTLARLAAAVVLVTLGALPASAQETGTIRGTATAASTMQPLVGAQISIPGTGLGTLTNSAGEYLIVGVPVGQHEVHAQMIGFGEAVSTVNVTAGEAAV